MPCERMATLAFRVAKSVRTASTASCKFVCVNALGSDSSGSQSRASIHCRPRGTTERIGNRDGLKSDGTLGGAMPEKQLPRSFGEPLPWNHHQLNKLAKEALNLVGEDDDPCYVYTLQLALWVLENAAQVVPDPAGEFAIELVEVIYV